jgi:pyrroloquinoline quinone (PQQ) biosynthesis protein C
MEGKAFIDFLKREQARKYPNLPAVYQKIVDGSLTQPQLQIWVKDMYTYWTNLYHSTSAIYVKTNIEPIRQNMLRKCVEIEGEVLANDIRPELDTPAYEELWVTFGEGIGLTESDITSWKAFTRTHFAMTTLWMYSRYWEWSWLDGVASLYAQDRWDQEFMPKVHQALKEKYNVPEANLEFFRVLERHVPTHFGWEEEALSFWACTKERQLNAARAFRERLDIQDQVLVATNMAITNPEKMPLQVPGTVPERS